MTLPTWIRLMGALWTAMLFVVMLNPPSFLRIIVFGGLGLAVFLLSWVWADRVSHE